MLTWTEKDLEGCIDYKEAYEIGVKEYTKLKHGLRRAQEGMLKNAEDFEKLRKENLQSYRNHYICEADYRERNSYLVGKIEGFHDACVDITMILEGRI